MKIWLIVLSILSLYSSCSRYVFEPRGTYVSGKRSIYYNDSLKLCLDIFGDYTKYNRKTNKGIRFDALYPGDKKILHKLHVPHDDTRILFSTIPIISPFHNIITLLRDSGAVDLKHYRHKIYLDTLQFYYDTLHIKKLEIEETLIPYRDKYIEFVYYNTRINDCPYCDIEDLTIKNRYRILRGNESDISSDQSPCLDSGNSKILPVEIPAGQLLKNKSGLLVAYRLKRNSDEKELETFKILSPRVNETDLSVCPGDYNIKYMSLDHNLIWQRNMSIK